FFAKTLRKELHVARTDGRTARRPRHGSSSCGGTMSWKIVFVAAGLAIWVPAPRPRACDAPCGPTDLTKKVLCTEYRPQQYETTRTVYKTEWKEEKYTFYTCELVPQTTTRKETICKLVPTTEQRQVTRMECVATTVPQQVTHYECVATTVPRQVTHYECVATTVPKQVTHYECVPTTVPRQVTHYECVPTTVPQQVTRYECVATTVPQQVTRYESVQVPYS